MPPPKTESQRPGNPLPEFVAEKDSPNFLLSLFAHNKLVKAINAFIRLKVVEGEEYGFRFSDWNATITIKRPTASGTGASIVNIHPFKIFQPTADMLDDPDNIENKFIVYHGRFAKQQQYRTAAESGTTVFPISKFSSSSAVTYTRGNWDFDIKIAAASGVSNPYEYNGIGVPDADYWDQVVFVLDPAKTPYHFYILLQEATAGVPTAEIDTLNSDDGNAYIDIDPQLLIGKVEWTGTYWLLDQYITNHVTDYYRYNIVRPWNPNINFGEWEAERIYYPGDLILYGGTAGVYMQIYQTAGRANITPGTDFSVWQFLYALGAT